ncbi:MAG: Maf family protein [Arsenophonus sp. NEOnobi-MAG3]
MREIFWVNLKDKNHDAPRILRQLSGKIHQLITVITFSDKQKILYNLSVSKVTLRYLTNKETDQYILSSKPMDKVETYTIQAKYGCFVK